MKSRSESPSQASFLMPSLAEQLDPRQPLVKLAAAIPWDTFENAFAERYSDQGARPNRSE